MKKDRKKGPRERDLLALLLKLTRSGFCKTDGAHHDGSSSCCGCNDAEDQSGDRKAFHQKISSRRLIKMVFFLL